MQTVRKTNKTIETTDRWYKKEKNTPLLGDSRPKVIFNYLNKVQELNQTKCKGKAKFQITAVLTDPKIHPSSTSSRWKRDISIKQVKELFELGHTDVALFVNTYPTVWSKEHRQYIPIDNVTSRWVMDMDDVIDHNGEECSTIDKLKNFFTERGAPLPSLIVQTDKNNFQVMYEGPPKYWHQKARDEVAAQIAGVRYIHNDRSKFLKLLKEGAGIDPQFYSSQPKDQKIRVPGSLKYKQDRLFVCRGWTNQNYNHNNPLDGFEFLTTGKSPKKLTPVTIGMQFTTPESYKIGEQIYAEKYPIIQKTLKRALPRATVSDKLAELFAQNYTFLKTGKYFLDQVKTAEKFECSQPNLSKILKKLIEMGYLSVTRDYTFRGKKRSENTCKEYRFGEVLEAALGIDKEVSVTPMKIEKLRSMCISSLVSDFIKGNTNAHFLKDIQAGVFLGLKKEEFVEFMLFKFSCYDQQDWMTERNIEKAWDSWVQTVRGGRCYVSNRPLVKIEEIEKRYRSGA